MSGADESVTDTGGITREELLQCSKRTLAETVLGQTGQVRLLQQEAARLELELAKLRAEMDDADWARRKVLELCDVTEAREMPSECWVVAKEIRAVYEAGTGKSATTGEPL